MLQITNSDCYTLTAGTDNFRKFSQRHWLARDKQLLGEHTSPWWSSLLVSIGAIGMAALPVLWLFAPA